MAQLENDIDLDETQTVEFLYFPYQYLKLSQVIKYYGQPSSVVAVRNLLPDTVNDDGSPFVDHLFLLYPDIGLILAAGHDTIDGNLIVSPIFVKTGLTSAQAELSHFDGSAGHVLAWQGFNSFAFYCRNPDYPDKLCTN
jgi:hypothetical protein